jgi:TonB family protein
MPCKPRYSIALIALSVCLLDSGYAAAQAAPVTIANPQAAVDAVIGMFTPNEAVNVETTGKPLHTTGSWGVQTKFSEGLPKACALARVPCAVVVYRVPEDKVVCEWTVGFVNVVETQPDGAIKHAMHVDVLDENETAARYTMKKAWSRGETTPRPVVFQRPEYPSIARTSGVSGVVTVRVVVGPDGLVKSVVATSGPPMLQAPVIAAVRQWKYNPIEIGQEPTSFRVDEHFSYNIKAPDFAAGMDPSGHVVLEQTDPHLDPGFRTNGVSSGAWMSCTGAGCQSAAPAVPK